MLNKIKSRLSTALRFKAASSKTESNSKPSLDKPIENPSLLAAMERVARDGSDEAKDALLLQLQQADFLAAIFPDELEISDGKNNESTIEKGSSFGVLSSRSEGKHFLVLFTDWKALAAYTDKKVSGWVLPSKQAWAFALQGETYDGIVINPAFNALPLERPMLKYLAHHAEPQP
ncbi:SseB family protein [Agaribacterium haliotis]|uniref:SseB family protein n=1 Tax=Agaribacterium haliotis TaxID=2013869 RepID=UPI0013042C0B|nr:SseB family protein [Agaribacterium haliotis]